MAVRPVGDQDIRSAEAKAITGVDLRGIREEVTNVAKFETGRRVTPDAPALETLA
jgi:hypothetical protein